METEVASIAKNSQFEGWLSKYQIADIEKLPHDHHLIQNMIAQLPSNQHHSNAWAEDIYLEYLYTNNKVTRNENNHTHDIKAMGNAN